MPGSSEKGKDTIFKWFKSIPNNKYVLDIGPGWGTYNKLLKEKGQIWHAVEIHKPYIKRFKLNKLYDLVFNNDIIFFKLPRHYDLIICGDILEHIKKKSVPKVLKKLIEKSNYIVISLPLDAETNAPPGTGDKDWGNPYELHVGKWSHNEFIQLLEKLDIKIIATEKFHEIAIYLIGTKKIDIVPVNKIDKMYFTLKKIKNRYAPLLLRFS